MEDILVSFKFFDGSSTDMRVSPCLTVGEMKILLVQSLALPPEEGRNFVIIFAGKALKDHQTLQEGLVRDATVLHVARRPLDLSVHPHKCLTESAEMEEHDAHKSLIPTEEASAMQCTFYGYCKEICADVTAALLRFNCEKCGRSAFVVDPMNELDLWDDIVDRGKVNGACYSTGCDGDSARTLFKCAAHRPRTQTDCTVYLRQIKLNSLKTPCSTCDDIRSPVLSFSCDSAHVMCLDCFRQYCVTLLNERRFTCLVNAGYTVGCPVGCDNGFVFDAHHFYLLGPSLYETFKEFAAEECFLKQGGTYCPDPLCGAPFIDESSPHFRTCPNGHCFCRKCEEPAHGGFCEELVRPKVETVSAVALENARSRRTIALTTKACPGCRTPIERNGGCMHVMCSRCGREFCWICETDWGIKCMSRHWFA